jgi:O-antigen ligase
MRVMPSGPMARSIDADRRIAARNRLANARCLLLSLACGWLLMLVTYSPAGRDTRGATLSTDAFAVAKLVVRVGVLAVFLPVVFYLWRSPRRGAVLRVLFPWAIFLAWATLSVAWSPLKSVSIVQAFSLGVLVLMSVAVALSCDGPQAVSRTFFSLALALLICSSVLLLLRIAQPESGSLSREGAGVLHSTAASAAAGLGIVLLVSGVVVGHWKWTGYLLVPGLAVHSATLILANNRMSLIATAAISLGLFLLFGRRGWRSLAVAAAAVVGLIYLTLDAGLSLAGDAASSLGAYAGRGQSVEELAALSGRAEMWEAIWKSFLDSPLIGHGYFVSSAKGELYVWYEWGNWTAHNVWLQVLVSTGVIGAALVLWGLMRAFGGVFWAAVRGTVDARLAILFASLVGWYLIWGAANESFVGPLQPESVVFFTCLGLAAGLLAGPGSQEELPRR